MPACSPSCARTGIAVRARGSHSPSQRGKRSLWPPKSKRPLRVVREHRGSRRDSSGPIACSNAAAGRRSSWPCSCATGRIVGGSTARCSPTTGSSRCSHCCSYSSPCWDRARRRPRPAEPHPRHGLREDPRRGCAAPREHDEPELERGRPPRRSARLIVVGARGGEARPGRLEPALGGPAVRPRRWAFPAPRP